MKILHLQLNLRFDPPFSLATKIHHIWPHVYHSEGFPKSKIYVTVSIDHRDICVTSADSSVRLG